MGILSGNQQKQPLHYGEVMAIWTNFAVNNGLIAAYQTFYNHTGDQDLAKLLEESIQNCKNENEQLEIILKVNGVALPPAPPERPNAKLESIPAGARFYDPEISAMLSRDLVAGLLSCSQAIGMCMREDIGMLFAQFHLKKEQLGAKLLKLNKAKGWVILPPVHSDYPDTY